MSSNPPFFPLAPISHSKLGNYELAARDFSVAEDKGFSDKVSLWTARGMVFR